MAREFCMLVEETSFGTPIAVPVVGTSAFYARLHESDAFTGQMNPVLLDIPYGGGVAIPALQESDQYMVPFAFRTYLYAGAYSAFLLNWCMTPINSGRTAPWTTTDATYLMPVGDLASVSIYHAFQRNDGTYDRRRYGGAKVHSWNLSCSRQSPIAQLTINGQAIRDDLNAAGAAAYPDATEFPAPTDAQYPTGPYLFSHTSGDLLVIDSGSTARTQYSSVTLASNNAMDPRWFESKYMILDKFCGRTSTLGAQFHLKPTPDDLAFFQAATALITKIKFDNGTHTFTIDFKSTNYLKSVTRSLPLNQVYQRSISAQNFYDTTAGLDLVLTTT